MIRSLIISVVVVIATTIGLGIYLQPNDLRNCGETPSSNTNCQTVDAIVAISGGDTEARAREAVELYKNGWSNIIIFSGAAEDKTGPSNAAVMKKVALSAGVPESVILLDEDATTTKENAINTQKIFNDHDIKSIILVTSGYHQRRASLEFNRYTEGVAILNHSTELDENWSAWWWTTPRGWWLAVSEIVKIVAFYTVGA
jgi:uncharacterized SAM-binding protein YcdF (DUF218 family)